MNPVRDGVTISLRIALTPIAAIDRPEARPMSEPTLPQHTVPPDDAASTVTPAAAGRDHNPAADGYRMIRKLGEGAFGAVWLAEDRAGGRAAIKFFVHGTGRQWN